MRILFATSHPHLPQIAGGLQSSADETAKQLAKRGHEVTVFCGLTGEGALGLRHRMALKLTGQPVVHDTSQGYRTYRAWFPWTPEAVEDIARSVRPDVVVGQGGKAALLVQAFARHNVPGVLYHHDVEFNDFGCPLSALPPNTLFISNSNFTRSRVLEAFGHDSAVIFPLIERERYAVKSSGEAVVFINPHPLKGLDIAYAVAEHCRDIPFLFVEAWILTTEARSSLKLRLQSLPNVRLLPRTSDMREIYGRARFILAPSTCEEAFGRVIAEGHISGLPAVASDVGGLPESTGPGGMLVDPMGPVRSWVDAVRSMWDDRAAYERYARAALSYSNRAELDIEAQLDALEAVLLERARIGWNAPTGNFDAVATEAADFNYASEQETRRGDVA